MNDPRGFHPWHRGVLSEAPMLIIAGGYRCGTTSLFHHLAQHPDISPSLIKEPAYFFSLRLQEDPQTSYPPRLESWGYLSLFRKAGARVRMEATSNYLNDAGCAYRIAAALPAARVVVLLRDPVPRLESWYRFLRFQGQMADGMSLDRWIECQLDDRSPVHTRPYKMQAVEHCRYAGYLDEYLDALGRERVLTLWFDNFRDDPAGTAAAVCRFADIPPEGLADRPFRRQNESWQLRRHRLFRWYRRCHRSITRLLSPWPRLQFEFKVQLFGRLEPRLLPFFTAPAESTRLRPDLAQALRAHLADDASELAELLGQPPPWAPEPPGTAAMASR